MRVTSLALPVILTLSILVCGRGQVTPRRELVLYPSETPAETQTPYVQIITEPAKTVIVVVTHTAESLPNLYVSAAVAVYLRPSPSTDNYPIIELPTGAQVVDLGGRSGDWLFVEWRGYRGWVYARYVEAR